MSEDGSKGRGGLLEGVQPLWGRVCFIAGPVRLFIIRRCFFAMTQDLLQSFFLTWFVENKRVSVGVSSVCVLLLQDLLQSCSRGGRRRVEDMCYERRRVEACVDESAHHALVNAGGREIV